MWTLRGYEGKGRPVGAMRPVSRAVIIDEGVEDFKVRSPLDNSVGWVNFIQVQRTLMQDVITNRICAE